MGTGIWGRAIKRGQERKAKELSHSKLRKMQCTRRQLDKVFFLIGKCSNCYGTSQNSIDWFIEKQCIKRKKIQCQVSIKYPININTDVLCRIFFNIQMRFNFLFDFLNLENACLVLFSINQGNQHLTLMVIIKLRKFCS